MPCHKKMVIKSKVIAEKIKYSGYGDFKEAYKYAYDWLIDERYKTIEKEYTEKIVGNGKEIEVKWECTKELSDYFKSNLVIRWRILGMTDVEVEIDGKKEKMNKFSELKIEITGTLEKDYHHKWEKSPFNKFLRDTYDKYIIPARVTEEEDNIKDDVQKFKEEMKAFFDLTAKK